MKNILITIILILLSFSVSAQEIFSTDDEFNDFFTYYYLNPQPQKIIPFINYYVSSELYNKVNSRMIVAHFAAYTLRGEDYMLEELFKEQNDNGDVSAKIFTLHIFWVADTDRAKELLSKAETSWKNSLVQETIQKFKEWGTYNVLLKTPTNPGDIDNLWGIFMATGNPKAIKQIMTVLPLKKSAEKEKNLNKLILSGSAEWSLTANAKQHEKVCDIIKDEAKNATGITKQILEEIIKKVEKNL